MSPTSLSSLILVRAVQGLEAQAALDDVTAMHSAHAQSRDPAQRVLIRAAALARDHGLAAALAQWRGRLVWVGLVAAGLVGLLSYGLVQAVVGDGRQINAVAALLAVLGPHLLSLALWLLMLVTGGGGGGGMARWGSGLALRLLGEREAAPGRRVLEAAVDVLARKPGLSAWAFGIVNHAIWSLALLLTLAGLVFAFSFLAYRLSWETTILDANFFARFAKISGWLPSQLGFATPNAAREGSDRGWALWLLGCTLVYGLGLRLIFLGLSLWRTSRLARQLTLDTRDPYVRQLMARFAAMDPVQAIDLEDRTMPAVRPAPTVLGLRGTALVGYELPAAVAWPPAGLGAALLANIAGASDEKRALLARLEQAPPQRLLLVCHAPSSPDRGTERFLREAAQRAGQTALLLLEGGSPRWRDWLVGTALPLAAVFDAPEAAQAWLADS